MQTVVFKEETSSATKNLMTHEDFTNKYTVDLSLVSQ